MFNIFIYLGVFLFVAVLCFIGNNETCGSEDFVIIYGPLEGSLVQQKCDWYAGLYTPSEVS